MKRKYLLLTFLALAIVTSLTAGTLAIYTTTETWDGNNVQAKKYIFTTAGNQSFAANVKLAPTESQDYLFTVSNADGSAVAEIPLDHTIVVDYSAPMAQMKGLQATLYRRLRGTPEADWSVAKADTTGSFTFTGDLMNANSNTTWEYKLTLTWTDTDNTSQTTSGETPSAQSFSIKVTAAQSTR